MLPGNNYIVENYSEDDVFKTESIRNFNKQLRDNLYKNIETLENELLSLTDLLIADGDLLQGNN